jgi:hypothetical protein
MPDQPEGHNHVTTRILTVHSLQGLLIDSRHSAMRNAALSILRGTRNGSATLPELSQSQKRPLHVVELACRQGLFLGGIDGRWDVSMDVLF